MKAFKKNKLAKTILFMSIAMFNSSMAASATGSQIPRCVWAKPNIKCSIPLTTIASSIDALKGNTNGNLTLSMSLYVSDAIKTAPVAKAQIPKEGSVWAKSYSLEQQKQYAAAADLISPILVTSSNNELALLRLGWLNYLQAKYNEAADYYHKAIAANNNSIDARLGLTLPLLAQQRWKEAALYANQVITISSWNYYGHIRLMTCEAGLAQWETLEKHAGEFTTHYPSDTDGFIFLARSQAMLGKKAQAIKNYEEVLFRSPANAEALDFLAKKQVG